MDNAYLSWRSVARRQWPLAGVLLLLLAAQATAWRGENMTQWAQLPGDLAVCALAVISLRRTFDTAVAAAIVMTGNAVLLFVFGLRFYGGDVIELAAAMALTAIVVRLASRGRAVTATVLLVLAYQFAQTLRLGFGPYTFGDSAARISVTLLLLAIGVGTGLYFRARDNERRRAEAASVSAAQQAERLALARELHDVVAHYVTTIVVHSQGAEAIADQDPGAARMVLPIITMSGHEALAAMRRLVGTLRGTEASSASRDNNELTEQIRGVVGQVGGPVQLAVELTETVPPELAQSVLRLVQESLTNALKHAAGVSRIDVDVRTSGSAVHVRVADDGSGAKAQPVGGSSGFGLVGMRERVELLGGRFTAGRTNGRGWTVAAELPLRD